MNAAARSIHQYHFFNGKLATMRLSWQSYAHMMLLLAILLSALAVIYSTNLYRTTLSQLELSEQNTNQLELKWGQLLLEQASLATPSRVEERAVETLHMVLPTDKQTFVLREK